MDYDEIAYLRSNHPTWRLLRADNAPLILAFLDRVFVQANASRLPQSVLIAELDDTLYSLNTDLDNPAFPKAPTAYLDDWAAGGAAWIRKFYISESDEPHFDLQPAVEKAILFVKDLQTRSFVGTESRLATIVNLLREIVGGSNEDVDDRLADLKAQRAALDLRIEAAERGEIEVLGDTAVRDRYQQVSRLARELLSDFREVEDNFRQLDRNLREQIAGWSGSKGELLDEVFGSQNSIADSDQGRSFQAFYDFLLSQGRQDELASLLGALSEINALDGSGPALRNVHFEWIDASERTQGTVRMLSDQLRRFLDDQVWLENRRVAELIHAVETSALTIKRRGLDGVGMEIDDLGPTVDLPFERPMYRRTRPSALNASEMSVGDPDIDTAPLFDQLYIDREALERNLRYQIADEDAVSLSDLLNDNPLTKGLAELVGYLSLQLDDVDVAFDEGSLVEVSWPTESRTSQATMPKVDFRRVQDDDQ